MELEQKILSGVFFQTSPTRSPARTPDHSRSPSPDPLFPADGDFTGSENEDDNKFASQNIPTGDNPNGTLIRGGRTGVKGVIRDANEVAKRNREKQAEKLKEVNRQMEKMALTARTYAEEEEERLREKAEEEGLSDAITARMWMFERTGKFGHLREVGVKGFTEAIDAEDPKTWVVIHIYDPSVDRCRVVDAILARVARLYPQTKFLRARAGAIGFATSQVSSTSRHDDSNTSQRIRYITEQEDGYEDEDDDGDDTNDSQITETDTDVLPTLLVYQGGQLVHNWIRVDWEADEWIKAKGRGFGANSSLESLLQGHNIIQTESSSNCGFPSDEEDMALEFVPGTEVDDSDEGSDEIFDL